MKKAVQIIPHLITSGNLVCGCLAIVNVLGGDLILGAYLVGIAALLDFFDGFAARLLKVSGEFGKQLDSLADCITFGVVPGMVMMVMIDKSFLLSDLLSPELMNADNSMNNFIFPRNNLSYLALLIPVFSAIRLAKFNIDARQNDSFIGLPTPANSIFIISLGYISADPATSIQIKSLILQPWILIFITCIFSFLLIAELPLFALKFKNFKWRENKIRYLFLALSFLGILFFKIFGLSVSILLYLALSVINNLSIKEKKI